MPRWILALLWLWLAQVGTAQEFQVANRTVQVHGFFSQGFVYTDRNNWLTMNTSQGSGAMTDMGLNMSSQVTDKFRVGAQLYDRNLGQLGQWHPSLDWAVVDYRFNNWIGIRAGKVKTTLGLYNDSQDLDFLRVFALLPQGVYPTDLRDATIAHTGADIYGNIAIQNLGDLAYTLYTGHRSDSIYSGYPTLIRQWHVFLDEVHGPQYGIDLRWSSSRGLTVGASRMNQEITGKGTFGNFLNPAAGAIPFRSTTSAYWTNLFYGEYQFRRLRIDMEYRRDYFQIAYLPGLDVQTDTRAWYVAGTYKLHKQVSLGSYYSHYTLRNRIAPELRPLVGPLGEGDASLPQNHIYDKVIAGRVDLNRFCHLKIEGHFMNGYGWGAYPNGFYLQQNPNGFQPNTKALVVKTGFHF
ncbi:MAG TPA: hypothetical protein VF123_08050 [Candidatus Sulfotelmatobacter sp.]